MSTEVGTLRLATPGSPLSTCRSMAPDRQKKINNVEKKNRHVRNPALHVQINGGDSADQWWWQKFPNASALVHFLIWNSLCRIFEIGASCYKTKRNKKITVVVKLTGHDFENRRSWPFFPVFFIFYLFSVVGEGLATEGGAPGVAPI